jgi:hypothetical protein
MGSNKQKADPHRERSRDLVNRLREAIRATPEYIDADRDFPPYETPDSPPRFRALVRQIHFETVDGLTMRRLTEDIMTLRVPTDWIEAAIRALDEEHRGGS